ncbi:hypothetical protein HED60_04290 [Planctomycetales bacterium ZRK34]|nr:hypothetical protein HED60_04290 [Planctomycetales bacterium ZRK34]
MCDHKDACVRRLVAALVMCALVSTAAWAESSTKVFGVRDYGAVGDGKTLDTVAIQKAIDAAGRAGGGRVVLSAGEYLSGGLRLRSHIDFHLEKGATLHASKSPEDYPHGKLLLRASEETDITLSGQGDIVSIGAGDLGSRWGVKPPEKMFRIATLLLDQCKRVVIRDVTIRNSDSWTLHLRRCDDVLIEDVKIRNNYRRLNSDGIDPNSCTNVTIRRCDIVAGDDAIVLKSTQAEPCTDLVIEDCTLESATAGVKFGTESHGDFRRIAVRNCRIINTPVGFGVYVKDGATVADVVVEKMTIQTCGPQHHAVVPLYIDIEKRNEDSKIGRVRNITFKDITIDTGFGLLMQAPAESPLENITLQNITMTIDDAGDYTNRKKPVGGRRTVFRQRDHEFAQLETYAAFANLKGLTIDGLTVNIAEGAFKQRPRSAITLRHVDGATLKRVQRVPGDDHGVGVIDAVDCQHVSTD